MLTKKEPQIYLRQTGRCTGDLSPALEWPHTAPSQSHSSLQGPCKASHLDFVYACRNKRLKGNQTESSLRLINSFIDIFC